MNASYAGRTAVELGIGAIFRVILRAAASERPERCALARAWLMSRASLFCQALLMRRGSATSAVLLPVAPTLVLKAQPSSRSSGDEVDVSARLPFSAVSAIQTTAPLALALALQPCLAFSPAQNHKFSPSSWYATSHFRDRKRPQCSHPATSSFKHSFCGMTVRGQTGYARSGREGGWHRERGAARSTRVSPEQLRRCGTANLSVR